MKRHITRLAAALFLSLGLGGATALAAIEADTTIEANIPYDFVVKDQVLPAGKYTLRSLDDTQPGTLLIEDARGKGVALVETESATSNVPPKRTELVFNRVGDTYFLSQVWLEGDTDGDQIVTSKRERELADGGAKAEATHLRCTTRRAKKAE